MMMKRYGLLLMGAAVLWTAGAPAIAQTPIARPALATQTTQPLVRGIDPAQLQRLEPIKTRLDAQILSAFKGNEKLKAQMESELNAIAAVTDPLLKRTMITAYQKKYGSQYRAILTKGGIDLAATAREMSATVPDLAFSVRDGVGFSANVAPLAKPATRTSQSTSGGLPPRAPTEVRVLTGADYIFRSSRRCTNIAGGDVAHSGGYMRATANAVVAGGCTTDGSFEYEFTVATGQIVDVDLSFDLSGESNAVGILGFARSSASGRVAMFKQTSNGRHDDFDNSPDETLFCASFALFLMSDSDACAVDNMRQQVSIAKPGRYLILARNSAAAFGDIGGSSSKIELHRLRATLTFRPQ